MPASEVRRATCARDGREHLVSDAEMDAGHPSPRVTLCGHEVLAAVLVCTAWSAVFGLYRSVQVAHRRP
jgi:hypothetical protein